MQKFFVQYGFRTYADSDKIIDVTSMMPPGKSEVAH